MPFASDEDKDQEVNRLAGLSDESFAATEAAYDRAVQAKHGLSKVEGSDCPNAAKQGADKETPETDKPASASADRQLRTDAGVRALDVDDKKSSLEDKLRDGFMTAYRERVGLAGSGNSN